jgi:hypothetical protein
MFPQYMLDLGNVIQTLGEMAARPDDDSGLLSPFQAPIVEKGLQPDVLRYLVKDSEVPGTPH